METQALCRPASFAPEHEVTVRRHIGDYTLFMLGVFRERSSAWPPPATT